MCLFFDSGKNLTTEELRNPDKKAYGIRVENGGWHFGYMARQKDEDINDAVAYKIRSAAHQELNNLGTMLRLKGVSSAIRIVWEKTDSKSLK